MIRFLLVMVLMLFAPWEATAKPRVSTNHNLNNAFVSTVRFGADTEDSDSIPVGGTCVVSSFVQAGSETVSIYQVPTDDTPTSSGTLVTTLSTTTTAPQRLTYGQPFLKAVASPGSTAGSILTIRCSNTDLSASGGDPFEAGRSGARGGGFDPNTGKYAWTVVGPQWSPGAAFVDCDGEASTASGDDGRCWADGERLMVDGTLDAFLLAADATMPGGTIYVPMFQNRDHGIYVYEECDTGTCPLIDQDDADPRKNQGNRAAFITAWGGRQYVGESRCRVDPITGRRTGVCLVDNSDAGTEPGTWRFRTGVNASINLCVPTSTTDPKCNVDAVTTIQNISHSITGVESALADTLISTAVSGGYLPACFNNTITTSHATTMGVCREDPRIRCTQAGDNPRSTTTTGGCDFGAGGDLGPCEGFVDYIEYAVETLGEDRNVMIEVTNFKSDGTVAGNGSRSSKLPIESVMATTCDGGDSRLVRLGRDGPSNGNLIRSWPFDAYSLDPASLTINKVHLIDDGDRDLGTGYSYQNIGFMPNNPFGRDSSLASADCTVGNESACDTNATIGIMSGEGGGFANVLFYGCSESVSRSCVDGQTSGHDAKIHRWEAQGGRRGLLSDLSRWGFRDGVISDWVTSGGVFQTFVSGARFGDLAIRNSRFNYLMENAYASDLIFEGVTLDNVYAEALIRLHNGQGIMVKDFALGGFVGHFAVLGADSDTELRSVSIKNVMGKVGRNSAVATTGFGASRAKSFISVTQNVGSAGGNPGQVRDISIDNVHIQADDETLLLAFDAGDDGVLGGATRANLGTEDYMPQVSLSNSSLYSTSGLLVGIANDDSFWDAGDSLDYRDSAYSPRLVGNSLNGVRQPDWNFSQMSAAEAGSCVTLQYGETVSIYDDTAVGACTDAGADGTLDGGGSSKSVCVCDPSSGAGGTWSAY